MGWKFWKKKEEGRMKPEEPRRTRNLSCAVSCALMNEFGREPQALLRLRVASKRVKGLEAAYFFRVFDHSAAAARGIAIESYSSLDPYPELILFTGTFDKSTDALKIEPAEHKNTSTEAA